MLWKWNGIICKNIGKFLQGNPLIFPDIFLKYWKFSFRTKVFFFYKKHTFHTIMDLLICASKNVKKNFFRSSQKNGFCRSGGGGGLRILRTGQLIGFFYAFPFLFIIDSKKILFTYDFVYYFCMKWKLIHLPSVYSLTYFPTYSAYCSSIPFEACPRVPGLFVRWLWQ